MLFYKTGVKLIPFLSQLCQSFIYFFFLTGRSSSSSFNLHHQMSMSLIFAIDRLDVIKRGDWQSWDPLGSLTFPVDQSVNAGSLQGGLPSSHGKRSGAEHRVRV